MNLAKTIAVAQVLDHRRMRSPSRSAVLFVVEFWRPFHRAARAGVPLGVAAVRLRGDQRASASIISVNAITAKTT